MMMILYACAAICQVQREAFFFHMVARAGSGSFVGQPLVSQSSLFSERAEVAFRGFPASCA